MLQHWRTAWNHTVASPAVLSTSASAARSKGYHELNSGTLQMLVKPAACSGVLFDYSRIPDIGALVRGRVAEIGDRSIHLEMGVELPFDYLVLAPGSTYADNAIKDVGGTAAERQALIEVRAEPGGTRS